VWIGASERAIDSSRSPSQRMHLVSRSQAAGIAFRPSEAHGERGAVLLEVVLALVLFVAAATVLTSGLSSSLDSLDRLRLNTHAADLGVSVMSELQLGIKSVGLSGPQKFEAPLEDWTWEVVSSPMQADADDSNPFKKIEVIIRHEDPPVVYRLGQVVRIDPAVAPSDRIPNVGSF